MSKPATSLLAILAPAAVIGMASPSGWAIVSAVNGGNGVGGVARQPDFIPNHFFIAASFGHLGRRDEGRRALEKAPAGSPRSASRPRSSRPSCPTAGPRIFTTSSPASGSRGSRIRRGASPLHDASDAPRTSSLRRLGMPERRRTTPPILAEKRLDAPSDFTPESLLREARRQKGLAPDAVPPVCVLDLDGDLVRRLVAAGIA